MSASTESIIPTETTPLLREGTGTNGTTSATLPDTESPEERLNGASRDAQIKGAPGVESQLKYILPAISIGVSLS
jgi:hypothetical protein